MADMVKFYGWNKVATFANSDSYGSSGIQQFQKYAAIAGVEILTASLFPEGQQNFDTIIAKTKATEARIFIFFMTAADMSNLIIQGYAANLFNEGTQIISADGGMTPATWKLMNDDAPMMMKVRIFYLD
jgi:ABC-type branched-subunit amino acid transport system substrate-binding protein